MQSVGEVMAIGRTFPESLQKALRSLETGRLGLNCDPAEGEYDAHSADELVRMVASATPERPFLLAAALRRGVTVDRLHEATGIDPCSSASLPGFVERRAWLREHPPGTLPRSKGRHAKGSESSVPHWVYLWGGAEGEAEAARPASGVRAPYKTVNTGAADFDAHTP